MGKKLKIGIVGLGFGKSFPPIYRDHPDVYTSANWTAAGICAHESAMKHGEKVDIPDFR